MNVELRNKTIKENFINKPAIYAILYQDKVIYVGQSTSVVNRLCDHANKNALKKARAKNPLGSKQVQLYEFIELNRPNIKCKILEYVSSKDLIKKEKYWITLLQPQFNYLGVDIPF